MGEDGGGSKYHIERSQIHELNAVINMRLNEKGPKKVHNVRTAVFMKNPQLRNDVRECRLGRVKMDSL